MCNVYNPLQRNIAMVAFAAKFLSAIYLSVVFAPSIGASPTSDSLYRRHATHRTRNIKGDLHLETYHPPTTYEVSGLIYFIYVVLMLSPDFRGRPSTGGDFPQRWHIGPSYFLCSIKAEGQG